MLILDIIGSIAQYVPRGTLEGGGTIRDTTPGPGRGTEEPRDNLAATR